MEAAKRIDKSAEELAEAITIYREIAGEQKKQAMRLKVHNASAYGFQAFALDKGLAHHLGGLAPSFPRSRTEKPLVETDWVAKTAVKEAANEHEEVNS